VRLAAHVARHGELGLLAFERAAAIAPFGALVVALVGMAGGRYVQRMIREQGMRPSGDDVRPVIVFGAGEGGTQVITAMLRDPSSPFMPVAIIDDDPTKRNLSVLGVPVAGDRTRLAEIATAHRSQTVVLALPSADGAVIRELTRLCQAADLDVKVLPRVRDLFGGPITIGDVRDVSEADLLGRTTIETDVAAIAGYVTGKRVLVTGAGGSIGSELFRQLDRYGPQRLVALDRDESGLHALELSVENRALFDSADYVLGDLRDRTRLERVFEDLRPEVVFHAAALKHLALLETHPREAVLTNVQGTLSLLELAREYEVARFVNISTDKAADPESVLGYSKRICERLTAQFAIDTGLPYLSVRFGNVLFSRGSVMGTFREQVASGGPITVTHPYVTRYFMTVQEAIELVIQAGAIGRPGEVLVLDMGDPVRIDDVARMLAARADQPIEIVYTGLRAGEKLHETLLGRGESGDRPFHKLVMHVPGDPLDPTRLSELDDATSTPDVIASLAALAGASLPNGLN
jgi:FlaA1/EpsC-like NDP-sugar epimerase